MSEPVKTAYSPAAAATYDDDRFSDAAGARIHRRELEVLRSAVARVPSGAKVLEVGCGTGRLMVELLDSNLSLAGTDASEAMLAEFRRKLGESRSAVPLVIAEAAHLQAPNSTYDLVYSIRLLNQTESAEYAKVAIRDMIRVTRPGGFTLVEFVNTARPRRRLPCTRLGVSEVVQLAKESGAQPIEVRGAFVLGMTAYRQAPGILLPLVDRIDRLLSLAIPRLAARCYVLMAKDGGR